MIVLNRTSQRSENFFTELTSTFPDADVHNVECDLQSFSSVLKAVAQIKTLS